MGYGSSELVAVGRPAQGREVVTEVR